MEDNHVSIYSDVELVKGSSDDPSSGWGLLGIASSENVDSDGDRLLRDMLDITYLQKQGSLNWGHRRDPDDQIGFIKQAEIIPIGDNERYEKILGRKIPDRATIFIRGELYPTLPKSQSVRKILSCKNHKLGLSIEGTSLRDNSTGVIKAVRVDGCAITPKPSQTETLCQLAKSLSDANAESNVLSGEQILLIIQKRHPDLTRNQAIKVRDYILSD